MSKFDNRPAQTTDVEELFHLVQAAYKLEIGTSGIAFKCADRYTTRSAVLKDISDMWVIRSGGPNHNIKARSGRQIIACAKGVIDATNQVIDIGPLAVHPDYQVITSNWESNMFLPL